MSDHQIVEDYLFGNPSNDLVGVRCPEALQIWLRENLSFLGPAVNVQDPLYGAQGNGIADDTAELNAAFAAGGGGRVEMPAGNYLISGTLVVPPGTLVCGAGACDLLVPLAAGTNISITHTSGTGVLLGRGASLLGINFWYPDQVTTSPPTVYPYTITLSNLDALYNGNNGGTTLRDIVIHNAYDGIDMGGSAELATPNVYGVTNLEGLRICAVNNSIRSGYTLSEAFLSNSDISCVAWPQSAGTAVRQWMMTNGGAGILFEATQGMQIANTVIFGKRWGIRCHNDDITSLTFGNMTFLTLAGVTLDGCRICIEVDGYFGIGGGPWTGCTFAAIDPFNSGFADAKGLYLNDSLNASVITISGCTFAGTQGSHIVVESPTSTSVNTINITGCTFFGANAGAQAGTFYNIYINDGGCNVILDGLEFSNLITPLQIVKIKVVTAAKLTLDGISVLNTTGKHFEIDLVTGSMSVHGVNAVSVTDASTWPAAPTLPIASAAAITLYDVDKNIWVITGTTTITSMTASWPGRLAVLKFAGILTVTDGGNLKLAGNFVTSADDTLTLVCDGTDWIEVARSVS